MRECAMRAAGMAGWARGAAGADIYAYGECGAQCTGRTMDRAENVAAREAGSRRVQEHPPRRAVLHMPARWVTMRGG